MKSMVVVCGMAMALSSIVAAQAPTTPVLQQQGIQVRLPVSLQAVAMPDADRADATVVTVTADGDEYLGTQLTDLPSLAQLHAATIYVKADAQAPYQQVLTVLSALTNRTVVLLTQSTETAGPGKPLPPYGISVSIGH